MESPARRNVEDIQVTKDEVRDFEHVVAANIKKWRTMFELTQEQLARRIGVSVYTVQKWEQASFFPKPESLIAIAKAFDLKPADLLKELPELPQKKRGRPSK